MKRALLLLGTVALMLPANAFARGEFDPTKEFEQHEWVPIHLGPLNLSITKAVAYLMLGSALTILFGLVFMRTRIGQKPGRKDTFGEMVYEVAQTYKEPLRVAAYVIAIRKVANALHMRGIYA